ncbi:MAG: hypothetical protein U0P45_12550 [Acidimicrobiales bacterium]
MVRPRPRARWFAATTVLLAALVTAGCGTDGSPSASSAPGGAADQVTTSRATAPSSGPTTTGASNGDAGDAVDDAIIEAVESERRAQAQYTTVIEALGPIAPFSNILDAERQHVAAVESLAAARQVDLPPEEPAPTGAPASRAAACRDAVTSEQEVIELYARLLPVVVGDAEATRVFTNLRDVSRDRHLPAFQRCS